MWELRFRVYVRRLSAEVTGPHVALAQLVPCRGTSLVRKSTPLGPYRRPMPRVLGGSLGGGAFSSGRCTPVVFGVGVWSLGLGTGLGVSGCGCGVLGVGLGVGVGG